MKKNCAFLRVKTNMQLISNYTLQLDNGFLIVFRKKRNTIMR